MVAFSLVKKADNNENENLFYKYRIEGDVQKDLYNLAKNHFNDKRVRNRNQNKYDAVIQSRDNKGFYLVNEFDYNHVKEFFKLWIYRKTRWNGKSWEDHYDW